MTEYQISSTLTFDGATAYWGYNKDTEISAAELNNFFDGRISVTDTGNDTYLISMNDLKINPGSDAAVTMHLIGDYTYTIQVSGSVYIARADGSSSLNKNVGLDASQATVKFTKGDDVPGSNTRAYVNGGYSDYYGATYGAEVYSISIDSDLEVDFVSQYCTSRGGLKITDADCTANLSVRSDLGEVYFDSTAGIYKLTSNNTPAYTLTATGIAAPEVKLYNDFNASKLSDVVIVDGTKLSILYDNSDGTYEKSGVLSGLNKWTVAVPQGDYNGDSRADVLITSKTDGIRTLAALFNTGSDSTISFKAHNIFRYYTNQWSYRGRGDVNGDGTTDICIVLTGKCAKEKGLSGRVVQMKELDTNGKVTNTVKWGTLGSGECVELLADIDGDSKAEIIFRNVNTDIYQYWDKAGGEATTIGMFTDSDLVGTGDFDGDGSEELLFYSENNGYNYVKVGHGGSLLGTQLDGWTLKDTGDYNGDAKYDILWCNDTTGSLAYSEADSTKFNTLITIA